jgi:hypothetical protein
MNIGSGSDRCPPYPLPPIEEKSEEDSSIISDWESVEITFSSESESESESEQEE